MHSKCIFRLVVCGVKMDKCFQTMEGHESSILCLVVANRLMYTGGADASARCWVTEFGDCTRHYRGHKHSVGCMKFAAGLCTCSTGLFLNT